MKYQVLLYYHFTPIEEPDVFAAEHEALCRGLNLVGRILVAEEGINGTVSGLVEDCQAYQDWFKGDERFLGMEFKVDPAESNAFSKLFVRARSEIITMGEDLKVPVWERTGTHLSPIEWLEKMTQEDVVILDGRNDYESELGHFRDAICPPLESFRDFPAWLKENRTLFEGKQILTYCTGGIRCEKLSAWMLQEGFENVFQLHGGIVKYGKDPETSGKLFDGVNVVFDDRIITPVGESDTLITFCRECGIATTNYVNCANVKCNRRILLCPDCETATLRCCSTECRESPYKREKNQKLKA